MSGTGSRINLAKSKLQLGLLAVLLLLGPLAILLPAKAAPAAGPNAVTPGDVAWMLTATGLVLLMTPGLSFFYGGMVEGKNVISTMLQSFIAMCVISLVWMTIGFGLAFGDSLHGVIGDPRTFFLWRGVGMQTHADLAPTIPLTLFGLFQLKFAIITPALITGSFAGRVRFSAYVLFMVLFTILIYAPLAHWTWHPEGFLHKWGVLDFAGGTVVHISAGVAALSAALALGRRKAHVENEAHRPANVPFVMLGTGMLWFGWFGFNAGSALGANDTAVLAFLTTNTASAAAAIAWLLVDAIRGRRPSALGACIGAVVGLVAITPAAGFVDVGPSIFIGAFGAVVSNYAVGVKGKSTLDDTLDVFPCHGVGGLVGMILTAVFAKEGGAVHGSFKLLGLHLLTLVIICPFVFFASYALLKLVGKLLPLRVSAASEDLGLDISQHGESIYEDTSQTDLTGPLSGRMTGLPYAPPSRR